MLLQRIASGDRSAVAECLEQYSNLVWSTARRWTSCVTDADDAVQEIFIDLWKSAGRFNPDVASEATFVMMIARRRLIDRRRRENRALECDPAEGLEVCDSDQQNPSDAISQQEDVLLAQQVLEELRDEEQSVLRMSIHDGLSHQQIAEKSGLPLGTVKTNIRRGLEKLRLRLEGIEVQSPARSVP